MADSGSHAYDTRCKVAAAKHDARAAGTARGTMGGMTDVEKALTSWAEGLDEETRALALAALEGPDADPDLDTDTDTSTDTSS